MLKTLKKIFSRSCLGCGIAVDDSHAIFCPKCEYKITHTTVPVSKSIISAAEKGIRIIPVASSGIDKWTEFLLRTEALMTGGTYTYITNDSGIGGGHIDATVPEKVVEYLNAMLIRLINEYHTGVIKEPIPYNQKQDK
jgi:hypothetical protein